MTSATSNDVKEIVFHPRSVLDSLHENLPPKIARVMIERLNALQNNVHMPDAQNRGLTDANGIHELRVNHDGAAYRVYHYMDFREVVFVIEAHSKKPTKGVNLPRADLARMLTRLKHIREHYETNRHAYERRYDERAARRRSVSERTQTWTTRPTPNAARPAPSPRPGV
jgi:phage-related protein